jgi:hypothetical protein
VQSAGDAFGQQAGREDQPQHRQGDSVAQYVPGRAAHAHRLRIDTLAESQRHARKHEQQQQIHQEIEDRLVRQFRGEIFEKDMPMQRNVPEPQVGDRFDPSDNDQQEPSEGQAHVHIAQQGIDLEDAAVQQRFAHHFPDRQWRLPRRDTLDDPHAVGSRKTENPGAVFDDQNDEHRHDAHDERNRECRVKIHRQKSPSLRLMSITTARVLIPRGHTRRHLPHNMHLFICS